MLVKTYMLIELHNLRIGNWLLDETEGHFCVFLGATDCVIQLERFDKRKYNGVQALLKPIPITRDRLSLCGFRQQKDDFCLLISNDVKVSAQFVANGVVRLFCNNKESPVISSIHKLQNELYSLTGKELEINLFGS